jgi:hypothetical protein
VVHIGQLKQPVDVALATVIRRKHLLQMPPAGILVRVGQSIILVVLVGAAGPVLSNKTGPMRSSWSSWAGS